MLVTVEQVAELRRKEKRFLHVEPVDGVGMVVYIDRRGTIHLTRVEKPGTLALQATTEERAGP